MKTKRVWRWRLTPKDLVVNERGLAWVRPYVSLLSYEELMHAALSARQGAIHEAVMSSSPIMQRFKGETK